MAPIPSIGVGAENASTVLLLLKLAMTTSKAARRKKNRISFLFVVAMYICLVSAVCRWRIEVSNKITIAIAIGYQLL